MSRDLGALHPWDLDAAAARALQRELAARVISDRPLGPYETIGGADVSYNKWSPTLYAAVVVLRADTLEVIDRAGVVAEATFPYVPGLLSFREAPAGDRGVREALGPPRRADLRRTGDRASATARTGLATWASGWRSPPSAVRSRTSSASTTSPARCAASGAR